MDIEELRRQIDSGELELSSSVNNIESGSLLNNKGKSIEYQINHGWDVISAKKCDLEWNSFNIKLFQYIEEQNYTEEKLEDVLAGIQVQDSHWNWFDKSIRYTVKGYEWFYMFTTGKPQAACLIYHPKDSIIDSENIFYIEYVAVAPWNRVNPMVKREFTGLGSLMIGCILNYAVNTLQLKEGFSLHSLSKAQGYYEKIGMINYQERNKEHLAYFEMPRAKAVEMLGVV